jgi:hypothetical protein
MTFSFGMRLIDRAALAALLLSASGAGSLAGAALSGRVVDEGGGTLPRATITVHKLSGEQFEQSSLTDSEGRYSFAELPDGVYSVEGALAGFVSLSYRPVRIYFPAQVHWDFELRVAGFGGDAVYASSDLVGELTWEGARVPKAKVCLTRPGGPYGPVCTTTNGLGQYFLEVPPGVYVATVDSGVGTQVQQRVDLSTAGEYRNALALPGAR